MGRVAIGMAQINTRVGDLAGNAAKILAAAARAHAGGARLLVTPEMALTGYPTEDLLFRPAFLSEQDRVLERLQADLAAFEGLTAVVGHVSHESGGLFNAASVFEGGRRIGLYRKQELPNYGVFDERRYFRAGDEPLVFEADGVQFGVAICEDLWKEGCAYRARELGAQAMLVLNASPFTQHKVRERRETVRRYSAGLPVAYVNQVGGQDELVFDGGSFMTDAGGNVCFQAPQFEETVAVRMLDTEARADDVQAERDPLPDMHAQVWGALVLAVRDYVGKTGFSRVLIGLSGGMDSALVLAIAVDALGAENVGTVMMPSRYTADISTHDAREMAEGLGVAYREIAIGDLVEAFDTALAPAFAGLAADTTEENIQARIRGNLLMALSNKSGALVLTTGNKSELATGYCTLYGDMVGAFAVLKDVPKTLVYALARWRNAQSPVIPVRIIERPPSAELRPDQTDQDSLPPYDVLDAILEQHIEHDACAGAIVAQGYDAETVHRVLRLVRISEYKRRQAAIGPNITSRAFGRGWRLPVACAATEALDG